MGSKHERPELLPRALAVGLGALTVLFLIHTSGDHALVSGQCGHLLSWGKQRGAISGVAPSLGQPRRAVTEEAPIQIPLQLSERHAKFAPLLDRDLWHWLESATRASAMRKCTPGTWDVRLNTDQLHDFALLTPAQAGAVVRGTALSLPCKAHTCCDVEAYFRTGSEVHDYEIFQQVFQRHLMRFLYPISKEFQPKYILDAGANAGFSAMLFKLLWPDAVVVSLEPEPSNYAIYSKNMAQFSDVHKLNAGLWGRRTKINVLTREYGSWGMIFQEVPLDSEGIDAYSVKDLAAMVNATGFDLIKVDIEGAEGRVFEPSMDLSWVDDAQMVLMETHDGFAERFGLQEVSSYIVDAFAKSSTKFYAVEDDEHVFLLAAQLRDRLLRSRVQ